MAVIGLDIGSDTIKVVEMAKAGRGFALLNYGVAPTPPDAVTGGDVRDSDLVGETIRQLMNNRRIKSKTVSSSVQGQQSVVVRIIELPRMSHKELGETMRFEVERHIPFAASQIIMDYAVLDRPGESADSPNMEVLFAAAQEEMIGVHVDALRQAKLKPRSIDVQPLALSRAMVEFAGEGRGVGETVAVVNIGAMSTDLSIIKDGILHFPRTIPIGGRSVTQRLSEGLGVSEQQAERLKRQYASMRPMARPARARAVVEEEEAPAETPLDFGLDLFDSDTQDDSDVGFGGRGVGIEFVPGGETDDEGAARIDLSDELDTEGPTFDFGDSPGSTRHQLAPDDEQEGTFRFDFGDEDDETPAEEAETEEPGGFEFDFSTEGEVAQPSSVENGIEFGAAGEEESDVTGSGAFDFSVGGEDSSIETDLGSTEGSATEVGSSFDLGDLATTDEADEPAEFDLGALGSPTSETPEAATGAPLTPEEEEQLRVREVIEPVIDEIAAELGRSLEYYRSRYDGAVVDRMVLVGGGSRIDGLAEYFEEELGLTVDRGDPLATLTISNRQLSDADLQRDAPLLAVAVGLAIRELA